MLFEQDYILRMIQMLGNFLRRLKEIALETEKRQELDHFCQEKCGLSLHTADTLSQESLTQLLPPEPRLILSELYYIRAQHTQCLEEERLEWLGRSARLLLSLKEESLICQERRERLHEMMAEAALSPEEMLDAFAFFLEGEAFDWAEDALFFALEDGAEKALQLGLQGFERLRDLSDKRLAAGGLSRRELNELIDELQARNA